MTLQKALEFLTEIFGWISMTLGLMLGVTGIHDLTHHILEHRNAIEAKGGILFGVIMLISGILLLVKRGVTYTRINRHETKNNRNRPRWDTLPI